MAPEENALLVIVQIVVVIVGTKPYLIVDLFVVVRRASMFVVPRRWFMLVLERTPMFRIKFAVLERLWCETRVSIVGRPGLPRHYSIRALQYTDTEYLT